VPDLRSRQGLFPRWAMHLGFYFFGMEDEMQGRCCAALLVSILLPCAHLCQAQECVGKLERVDLQTVTVRSCDNQKAVFKVDGRDRGKAAPYLGKSVAVEIKTENGEQWAVLFRACR